jgi:signal transduction histidine kinase
MKKLHVLIVEDSEDDTLLLVRELRRGGYEPVFERIETPESMKVALEKGKWDIVISDFILPGFSGFAALDVLKRSGMDLPFIIVSGKIGESTAVDAMKAGAHDYIMKDNMQRLLPAVERELREAVTRRERRAAEETLKSYMAKLELMNQELQDFAFIASHDLQEPLRKIQVFGSMLIRKHKDSLNPEAQQYTERITKAANRMSELLRSLLDYSRTGTSQLNYEPVSLTEVAKEVTGDLEFSIHKVKGSVEISELPTVDADAVLLRQLFQNIIGNSLKYRKESEPPVVKIYGSIVGSVCQVFIEDNGIGFDECYSQKIFKPFERLHGKNAPYNGSGMGLAICKKIVNLHGGEITVRSAPEKGTTFIVTLPVEQEKRA